MIDYIVECPCCGKDNPVFFDDTIICQECLHEWIEESPEDSEYDKLVKLEKPFFKLKHGKLLCYYYENNILLSDDEAKLFDFIEKK